MQALERPDEATDPATRREFGKLADSYLKLAEQADGMQQPFTGYPGDEIYDQHIN